jgi:hypothetical protein
MYAGNLVENETKQESDQGTKPKSKLEISVVEGSFRRIAGIREFADDSGTFVLRVVEILREPGESLGFYIRQGDGWDRNDGMFVSRVNLGSIVETSGLLSLGDEITKVNDIDVTHMPLETVTVIMRYVQRLFLTVKVLTSPALVSLRSNQKGALNNSTDGTVTLRPKSGDREVSVMNRRARVIPDSSEALVPYAYTRIGPETQADAESPGYETVRHEPLRVSTHSEPEKHSAGSPRKLGGSLGDVNLIDHEKIDQMWVTEPHSGVLSLVLDTVDNLIPPSDDAPLVCSVSCDSEQTVEVSVTVTQLKQEGVAKINHEYHIQLTNNHKISFRLVNGILSSVKTVPFAYFFPTPQTPRSRKEFALILSPIGRLQFSLGFSPMPSAIPRWGGQATPTGGLLKDGSISANGTGSGLPLVVERAIRVVEEYGIETPGLYQVTAHEEAKGEALTACQNDTLHPCLLRGLVPRMSLHAFTGVLKDFFLNLPQPLFPPDFTASVQDAVNEQLEIDEGTSIASFIEPLPNKTAASALLAHFRAVCQHGATNGTSLDKISQVFAPLLFTPARSDQPDENTSRGDFTRHAHILKTLVLHCK